MKINIEIEDKKVINFSASAKNALEQKVTEYANEIVKEANLIEEGLRDDDAQREITSTIISQAVRKSKISVKKKPSASNVILRVVSALSLATIGFFYDPNGYANNLQKLYLFIAIIIIAAITTLLAQKE